MSFGRELRDFTEGMKAGAEVMNTRADIKAKKLKYEKERLPTEEELAAMPDPTSGGKGVIPETHGTGGGGSKRGGVRGDELAWKDATPEQRGLLNAIAGPESGGRYNVIYGGKTFDDYSRHPGIGVHIQTGPNAGRTSSAAGKYQFLGSTFNGIAEKYGLKDFSPENQDKAAWFLANDTYKAKTGRDLMTDLKSGDPKVIAGVGSALRSQWTSLPGGIEQGQNTNQFVQNFTKYRDAAPKTATAMAEPAAKAKEAAATVETAEAQPEPEQSADASSLSPEAGISVEQPEQVASIQAPIVPPEEEWLTGGTTFAASGGAIPEPQRFQGGGAPYQPIPGQTMGVPVVPAGNPTNPSGAGPSNVDRYSPYRAYTQKITPSAAPTWTPRRISAPAETPGLKMTDGLTPSQLAYKQSLDKLAADRAAAEAAKAKPATPAPAPVAPVEQPRQWMYDISGNKTWGAGYYRPSQAYGMGGGGGYGGFGGSGGRSASGGRYQEGGAIPDTDEEQTQYLAKGGMLKNRDEVFQRLLKEESSVNRGGQEARDAAARRLSALEGRPSSTAYSPGYWRKATPKKDKGGGKSKVDTTKTSSTDKPGEDAWSKAVGNTPNPYETKPGAIEEPELQEDRATRFRKSELDDLGEDRATRFREAELIPGPSSVRRPPGAAPAAPGATGPFPARPDYPAPNVPRARPNGPFLPRPEYPGSNAPTAAAAQREPPFDGGPNVGTDINPGSTQPPTTRGPFTPEPVTEDQMRSYDPYGGAPGVGQAVNPGTTGGQPELVVEGNRAYYRMPDGRMVPYVSEPNPERFGYQHGGIIPEPGEPGYNEAVAHGATATQDAAASDYATSGGGDVSQAEANKKQYKPTPRLMSDVSKALDGGVKFLTRHFGLQQDGAVETPEGQQAQADGTRRFADGEGAATPDEINAIDDHIDPHREMPEGDRQMARMAKIVQWYLERGRKDDAEAAAAGLMQYGGQRVQRLGSMAAAAYNAYQKNGRAEDLKKTTDIIEAAYEMVPDGGHADVSIDPDTGELNISHTDADGNEQNMPLTADQLPAVIQGIQSKSLYWQQIMTLADPEGAHAKQREEAQSKEWTRQHGITSREAIEKEGREAQREKDKQERELKIKEAEHQRTLTEGIEKEKRTAAENDRQALRNAAIERAKELAKTNQDVQWDKVNPLLGDVAEAMNAEDADSEEGKAKLNNAYSRLMDSLPAKNRAETFQKLTGAYPSDFQYTPAASNEPKQAKDGKWYRPDPARPGKYIETTAPAGA